MTQHEFELGYLEFHDDGQLKRKNARFFVRSQNGDDAAVEQRAKDWVQDVLLPHLQSTKRNCVLEVKPKVLQAVSLNLVQVYL